MVERDEYVNEFSVSFPSSRDFTKTVFFSSQEWILLRMNRQELPQLDAIIRFEWHTSWIQTTIWPLHDSAHIDCVHIIKMKNKKHKFLSPKP